VYSPLEFPVFVDEDVELCGGKVTSGEDPCRASLCLPGDLCTRDTTLSVTFLMVDTEGTSDVVDELFASEFISDESIESSTEVVVVIEEVEVLCLEEDVDAAGVLVRCATCFFEYTLQCDRGWNVEV